MTRLFARRQAPAGTVLYDAPGPRTKLITYVVSAVATVVIAAGVYFLIYLPLDEKGQFTQAKWGPIVDPTNKYFDQLWQVRLVPGILHTLTAAALAILASLIMGTALAILRIQLQQLRRRNFTNVGAGAALALRGLTGVLNAVTRFCVEVFRGLPVVITIFFVGRGLPEMGLEFDTLWFLVIGLTIYNGVVIGEILRSGMTGLPVGQAEAAVAIGMSPLQTTRMVLLPQAYRIMLPALISQVVVVLKDTSLGFLIGYEDLLGITQQVVNLLKNPIQLYLVIGLIYIVVNYALSKLAQYVQRRLARGRRTPAAPALLREEVVVVAGTAT
ncbi:MAG: glutamate transport system permease protein [Micromonosporaceae bacterium]|jgi:glutamate transport system permease protein|nr:glutamate transport system permease protein [Micromonosporaceae bacterium]